MSVRLKYICVSKHVSIAIHNYVHTTLAFSPKMETFKKKAASPVLVLKHEGCILVWTGINEHFGNNDTDIHAHLLMKSYQLQLGNL